MNQCTSILSVEFSMLPHLSDYCRNKAIFILLWSTPWDCLCLRKSEAFITLMLKWATQLSEACVAAAKDNVFISMAPIPP